MRENAMWESQKTGTQQATHESKINRLVLNAAQVSLYRQHCCNTSPIAIKSPPICLANILSFALRIPF